MSEPEDRRRMVRAPTSGDPAGRASADRLKSSRKHTASSQKWLERQLNDPYVQRAHAEGWRSRAAFKLMEIDDRFGLLRSGLRVIDLGAAPGGWVQVALKRGASAVAGVDLLPIDPIRGADLIEADFTTPGVGEQLLDLLGGPPDLVLSDMAHNTVGHRQTDHLKIVGLIEAAADFALANLKPGGGFVVKTFQGGAAGDILAHLKAGFTDVKHVKPKASRSDSSEVYLVATGCRVERGR
ncbi:RlmE family RNA methyltransferase [Caulobacter sp. S45]|jgi:23S rRNA (uridine2552-2'-O)-methyltransferase|uniref:RlmE family RNA methyltransferase n=1 Tax=Caulobacter sp. S45 TaxID=1641861 RepID=UPI00131DB621|nr:RlmE family RNA methyltransferase [Caulobacter sp. S45]